MPPPLYNPQAVRENGGWALQAPNTAAATHAATVLTYYSPGATLCCGLYGVAWSYSGGTPAGGRLTVADGTTVFLDIDLPAAAVWDRLIFPAPFIAAPGNNLVITLADGGGGIVGKLSGIVPFEAVGYPATAIQDLDFSDPNNSGLIAVVL